MKLSRILMIGLVAAGVASSQEAVELGEQMQAMLLQAQDRARAEMDQGRAVMETQRSSLWATMHREDDKRAYDQATRALDGGQWAEANKAFAQIAAKKGPQADGALYWQAYAASRMGEQVQALAALETLISQYASSRWLEDAKALQVEIRQRAGRPVNPDDQTDADLKLIALVGLIGSNPDVALPVLEKMLHGAAPPRVKDRALFVLTQSNTPQARQMLSAVARGKSNPDLQLKAVRYLGMTGSPDVRKELGEIYRQSTDTRVKSAILGSYMLFNAKEPLLEAAKSEHDPQLRRQAIQQLGMLHGHQELWQLYHAESSVENKVQILNSLMLGEDFDALLKVASEEADPRLRAAAIQSLSFTRGKPTEGIFESIYTKESDAKIKRQILNAMFFHRDTKALISIARNEKDPQLKREAVTRLSQMHSKEATDYLRELLEK